MNYTYDAAVEELIYNKVRELPEPGKINLLDYLRSLVSKEAAAFLPGTTDAQDP